MWVEAIVMPRQNARPSRPPPSRGHKLRGGAAVAFASAVQPLMDRRPAYEEAYEESRRFRDSVVAFLQAHHLLGSVRWISEPGGSHVTLHCTRAVLERLRQAPEFEAGLSMTLELPT